MIIKNYFSEEVSLPSYLQQEAECLKDLGVNCSELEFIINLKIDKEITLYYD